MGAGCGDFTFPILSRGIASPLAVGGKTGSFPLGDIGQFPDKRARASQLLYAVLPVGLEDKLVVRLQLHRRAIVVHELHEPLRIGELLVAESDHGPFRPRVHLRDAARGGSSS